MIALKEIEPVIQKDAKSDKEKEDKIQPVSGMIVEIEEVSGEQKYIYIRIGSKNRGIKTGLKGYIFNDPALTEKIGKFQFIEVYREFSKGQIIELNYKVKPNALVLVEIDPGHLIE